MGSGNVFYSSFSFFFLVDRGGKVRVLFTGISDPDTERDIARLGGETVTDVKDCTHVFAESLKRTLKLLKVHNQKKKQKNKQTNKKRQSGRGFFGTSCFILLPFPLLIEPPPWFVCWFCLILFYFSSVFLVSCFVLFLVMVFGGVFWFFLLSLFLFVFGCVFAFPFFPPGGESGRARCEPQVDQGQYAAVGLSR